MFNRFIILVLTLYTTITYSQSIQYPVTEQVPHQDSYFDTIISDPYQWLEDDNAEATHKWVVKQNELTSSYIEKIPYRQAIEKRFSDLFNYEKAEVPIYLGNFLLMERNNGLQNQAVFYIKNHLDTTWHVLLDPNTINKAGTTSYEFSAADKAYKYLAFNVNHSGSDWSQIIIFDINTTKALADTINWVKFSGAKWYGDGFFYSRYPEPKKGEELSAASEHHKVYYHKLGTQQSADVLIYEDTANPRHYHYVDVSHDERYLYLYKTTGTNGFETYVKDLKKGGKFMPLYTGFEHKSTIVGNDGNTLYILTDIEASNYKLIAKKINCSKSRTIIPESEHLLESVALFGNTLYAKYLENASNKLYQFSTKGKKLGHIPLPDIGTLDGFVGGRYDRKIYYKFSGFTNPGTLYEYDVKSAESTLFFRPSLQFNPDDFESKQIWYSSKDSTRISMFIVHKKGIALDGKNPTYLYGYGGFNINLTPTFSTSRIMLLENGGIFAMPNLRGGGEYGEEWHQKGMLMQKQNVFDDFISAAEYLISKHYTSTPHLGIGGGSNGGLLVGACMTQRPDLFAVALPAVGVMDMLKFHKFTVGWGWVPEYGSSDQSPEMFRYLYSYSPYHQLRQGIKYPATLVTTADHDDRVVPAHSFKFAARLQEYHKGDNPVLIRIETEAGHGFGMPTSKIISAVSDQWSFFFWNTGIKSMYGK
jgi:prolyl oligopeptidase